MSLLHKSNKEQSIQSMGVINITPNSFSDGNQFNNHYEFKQRFESLLNWASIIDIGAESTAPFNDAIDIETELGRFKDCFYPILKTMNDPAITLSVDTYKIEVFKGVYDEVKQFWPKTQFIFNDISGSIDQNLLNLFVDIHYEFDYVYCHNLAQNRSISSSHMDYCQDVEHSIFLRDFYSFFDLGLKKMSQALRDHSILNKRVYLDPCFGFSKTRDQNHYLMSRMGELSEYFSCADYIAGLVYGVSRKSFMRFPQDMNIKNDQNSSVLTNMQSILFYDLFSKIGTKHDLIFRVHDNVSLKALENIKKIFAVS